MATDSLAIAPNTNITGFSFLVRTTTTFSADGLTGGQIASIAQVFGTSNGGTTLVYDESGDQTPSNFTDAGTPGSNTPTTGVATPTIDGTDPGNNAGTDTTVSPFGGEDHLLNIPAPGVSAVLLGPEGAAGATGPTNNNDDFTNRAASFPTLDTPANNDTTDPAAIAFVNSVQNNGNVPANISIIPTAPTNPLLADLPNDTLVTVSATGVPGSKTYRWDAVSSTFVPIDGAPVITINGVTANGGISAYNVSIDLPIRTTLSTDLFSSDSDGE